MWKIAQCAIQGRGHLKDSVPCQDKTYYCKQKNVVVSALADGAGSARLSHIGAEYITKFICTDFANNFDSYFENQDGVSVKKDLDCKIKNAINKLADENKCDPKDLASTLLLVAIKEDRYILLHIGDGVIGYSKNKELKVASQPENGEFVNTTIFTISKNVIYTMKMLKGNLGDIDGFVLMSDGTETSLYDKKEKKLAIALKNIMEKLLFLSVEKFEELLLDSFYSVIRNTTFDDCSILIMLNLKGATSKYLSLDDKIKYKIWNINFNSKYNNKQFLKYEKILTLLNEKKSSLKDISKEIHLKPKYTKQHLDRLIEMNLIEKNGVLFRKI